MSHGHDPIKFKELEEEKKKSKKDGAWIDLQNKDKDDLLKQLAIDGGYVKPE